jgi:mannose-6-phosphate isomerase
MRAAGSLPDAMKLTTHLVEKPWGRTDIPPAFGDMGGRKIGEIWYDDGATDPLPILVKWLFTSQKLSIQVHPDDAQAKARGLASGKEECWVIVSAEPGATLGMGTQRQLSPEELREASLSGEIEALMDWKPVHAGDYFYIPAGTVHAIGAGITLVEVQQYADITYRLYDYGRPRELHLEDGVAVSRAGPYADPRSGHLNGSRRLVDGPHFRLDYVAVVARQPIAPSTQQRWIIPLTGSVSMGAETVTQGECALADPLHPIVATEGATLLIAENIGDNSAP